MNNDVCECSTKFDRGQASIEEAVETLCDYEHVFNGETDHCRCLQPGSQGQTLEELCLRDLSENRNSRNDFSRGGAKSTPRISQSSMSLISNSTVTWTARLANRSEENHDMDETKELRLPALEIAQGPNRLFYSFAVDGKLLPQFTTVSRIRRRWRQLAGRLSTAGGNLAHCGDQKLPRIRDPLLPNAIVIAFDDRVKFLPSGETPAPYSRWGTLVVPLNDTLETKTRRAYRRWPATNGGNSGCADRKFPDLRHRIHRQRRTGTTRAVHSRELDEAPSQGAYL